MRVPLGSRPQPQVDAQPGLLPRERGALPHEVAPASGLLGLVPSSTDSLRDVRQSLLALPRSRVIDSRASDVFDADAIAKSARYVLDTRRYLRAGPNVEYLCGRNRSRIRSAVSGATKAT